MSRWEPVAYADVKVGDEIKSESPCGTVRRGVVRRVAGFVLWDAAEAVLGLGAWALYRRVPKPAKFVPLDVPEVGQWITATYTDGHTKTGKVEIHWVFDRCVGMQVAGGYGIINTKKRETGSLLDIIAWSPTEPPAPAEPTTFGYVGFVTRPSGDVWHITRRGGIWTSRYLLTRQRDGEEWYRVAWADVLTVGTFTAVER